MIKQTLNRVGWGLALLSLLTLPVAASSVERIHAGADLWVTPSDGSTYVSFELDPIPAGFFCASSKAFTDTIEFGGSPLDTADGPLGRVDTVVERLDDAVFDEEGVAYTRIRVRALSIVSLKPLETGCGLFNVSARLDGEQPTTHMRISRNQPNGGTFLAPLAMEVKIVFTSVGFEASEAPDFEGPGFGSEIFRQPSFAGASQALELHHSIRFSPSSEARWSERPGETGRNHPGAIVIDANGDGNLDTYVSGTSNFAAGWTSRGVGTRIAAIAIPHCAIWDPALNRCLHSHTTNPDEYIR